jgi:hypothetical protein
MELTQESIHDFAAAWYRGLDEHIPQVQLTPLLLDDGLEMRFPEATVYGHAGFEGWYQRVIRIFFDEVHQVVSTDAVINGDSAEVKVVVHWEASVWNAPEAHSKRISLTAYQTWTVRLIDGAMKVAVYTVESLAYDEGSATL